MYIIFVIIYSFNTQVNALNIWSEINVKNYVESNCQNLLCVCRIVTIEKCYRHKYCMNDCLYENSYVVKERTISVVTYFLFASRKSDIQNWNACDF